MKEKSGSNLPTWQAITLILPVAAVITGGFLYICYYWGLGYSPRLPSDGGLPMLFMLASGCMMALALVAALYAFVGYAMIGPAQPKNNLTTPFNAPLRLTPHSYLWLLLFQLSCTLVEYAVLQLGDARRYIWLLMLPGLPAFVLSGMRYKDRSTDNGDQVRIRPFYAGMAVIAFQCSKFIFLQLLCDNGGRANKWVLIPFAMISVSVYPRFFQGSPFARWQIDQLKGMGMATYWFAAVALVSGYDISAKAMMILGVRQENTTLAFSEEGCQALNVLLSQSLCTPDDPYRVGKVTVLSNIFGELLIEVENGQRLVMPTYYLRGRNVHWRAHAGG